MKKISCVLLLVVVLCGLLAFCACDKPDTLSDDTSSPEPTPADYFTFKPNADRTSYVLTGTQKILPADVVIPSEYDGLPVTEIGASAFEGCTEIESVVLNSNLQYIHNNAFFNCASLSTINFNEHLKYIGENSFNNCVTLSEIYLPNTLQFIGNNAFENCSSINEIVIPSTLQVIRPYTFKNCTSLKKIELTEGIKQISYGAFYGCSSLQNVTFPSSLVLVLSFAYFDSFEIEFGPGTDEAIDELLNGSGGGMTAEGIRQMFATTEQETRNYPSDFGASFMTDSIFEGCSNLATLSFSASTHFTLGALAGIPTTCKITFRNE